MPHGRDVAPLGDRGAIAEIRTTFSRRDDALACAARLVTERLAACVQVDGPVTSVYRWQGAVETSEEFRCTCKTSHERVAACVSAILSAHDYRTPEMIVTEVAASRAYAEWVRGSVEPEA